MCRIARQCGICAKTRHWAWLGDLAFRLPEYGKPRLASLQLAREIPALNNRLRLSVATTYVVMICLAMASWCAALI